MSRMLSKFAYYYMDDNLSTEAKLGLFIFRIINAKRHILNDQADFNFYKSTVNT